MQIDRTTWQSPNAEPRTGAISAVVLHSSGGGALSGLRWLTNPASRVSSHYFVTRDGAIFQLVADDCIAWHAGVSSLDGVSGVNDYSIGIECEHMRGQDWPPAQIQSLTDLCRDLMQGYHIPPSRIVSHRFVALPPGRKVDPDDWAESAVRLWAESLATHAPVTRPDLTQPYTPDSPILGLAPVTADVVAHRWPQRPSRLFRDVPPLLAAYWERCGALGIDAALASAQLAHETDFLGSWWSLDPRRNPAGLGVTGAQSLIPRGRDWVWNPSIRRFVQGLSFATWDAAIAAHLGRLLAYALPVGAGTTDQQAAIATALALRPLPATYRGAAPTLRGLNTRWATGSTYADGIVRRVNQLTGLEGTAPA